MKKNLCVVLLLMSLVGGINTLSAINVVGYIITNLNDTLSGTIQISKFDQAASGIKLGGDFDQVSLSTKVFFKKNTDRSFKAYTPDDIKGFGFNYRSSIFTFRQMEVPMFSLFQREGKKKMFLCLVYEGFIELYKISGLYENLTTNADQRKFKGYTDFYLYTPENGLVKVEQTDKVKTVRALLQPFKLDEKFTREIPDDINFRDIVKVLSLYDKWLMTK